VTRAATWRDGWPEDWRQLPVCARRQLPIPVTTARHPDGTGRFNANDVAAKLACAARRLCGVCSQPLGPSSDGNPYMPRKDAEPLFLTADGPPLKTPVFTDAPIHDRCAVASLDACPHIARPRVPRRPDPHAAVPAALTARPKDGWLMWYTATWEIVEQPAAGGGTVWGFRPGPATRIRRFTYREDGQLAETWTRYPGRGQWYITDPLGDRRDKQITDEAIRTFGRRHIEGRVLAGLPPLPGCAWDLPPRPARSAR
jgi:hypothetical protein